MPSSVPFRRCPYTEESSSPDGMCIMNPLQSAQCHRSQNIRKWALKKETLLFLTFHISSHYWSGIHSLPNHPPIFLHHNHMEVWMKQSCVCFHIQLELPEMQIDNTPFKGLHCDARYHFVQREVWSCSEAQSASTLRHSSWKETCEGCKILPIFLVFGKGSWRFALHRHCFLLPCMTGHWPFVWSEVVMWH